MTANPYLEGNFAPVDEEVTASDLEVEGQIPSELEGRLLRIGPNPIDPDPATHHWFIGNGMVHGVRLRGGKAEWYRNRYVRDSAVCAAKGWDPLPGPTVGGPGGDVANTNVIAHAGKIFAIVEAGGLPVELSDDLESVARSDFDGTLDGGFTAHPKRDPRTGELHAAVYSFAWKHIRYIVVGTDGRVRKQVDVPTPGSPMVHDCQISENYFVLFDMPVVFNMELAAKSGLPYQWSDDYGARIGLLPREGNAEDVTWCEVDPCYIFHPMNAYEEGGKVVLDVCRHPKMFATDMQGPNEGAPIFHRYTLDPRTGASSELTLDPRGQEFPRHDERLIGQSYRYGYTACVDRGLEFSALLKHDLRDGKSELHSEGGARRFMEPVFVPRSADAAEDDGWVMAYVYDASTHQADVVILHAQDFSAGPVATIKLPQRVPFGFHGNWVPDAS